MAALLCFIGILLSGDFLAVTKFNRKFGEVTPFTLCAVSLLAYCFGLFHLLSTGVWVIGLGVVGIYAFGIFTMIKQKRGIGLKKAFLNPVFYIFMAVCVIGIWGDYGQMANGYDDIGHWQDCVKVMVYLDDFYANPAGNSTFGTYPPFMAMIQYAVQMLNMNITGAEFCEWINFYVYHIFTFALFLPALVFISDQEHRNKSTLVVAGLSVMILPTIFFQRIFTSTMIDPFLAVEAGVAFFLIAYRKKIRSSDLIIGVLLPALVLTKDLGMLFAVFLLLFLLYCSLKEKNYSLFMISLAGVVFATVSWTIVKAVNHTVAAAHNAVVNWLRYMGALFGKFEGLEDYKVESVTNFRTALFDRTAAVGNTFVKMNICYFLLIIIVVGLFIIWYFRKRRLNEQEFMLPNLAVYIVMLAVFLFGLGGVYMDKYVYTEAVALASYERYVNTVINILVIELSLMIMTDREIYNVRNSCILLAVIIAASPINTSIQFLSREAVKQTQQARMDADSFAAEIVENCEEGSRIYLVSQGNKGWDYLVIKFMSRPYLSYQSIAGDDYNWSFAEQADPSDIYTKRMTPDLWREELFESDDYDYVAIARSDNYLQTEFISLFKDTDTIKPHSIYRIDRSNQILVPVFVKEN